MSESDTQSTAADPAGQPVALVTGAAFGLGRSAAELFAKRGYRVVAADVDAKLLDETIERITAAGGEAVASVTDVTKPKQVEAMVQLAADRFGRLDAAVNNAAIPQPNVSYEEPGSSFVHEMTDEDWQRVIDIDITGVFYCLRSELAYMRKQGRGGAIVNLSSGAAILALEGMAAYNAAKKAVFGLTETAALENGHLDIRVNTLVPGNMWGTKMFSATLGEGEEAKKKFGANSALNRPSTPDEQAEAIFWLCSDRASYVTGVTIRSDGGMTIRHPSSHKRA